MNKLRRGIILIIAIWLIVFLYHCSNKKQIIKLKNTSYKFNYKPSLLLLESVNIGSQEFQEYHSAIDDYLLSLFTLQSDVFIRLPGERRKAITQVWGKKNVLSESEENDIAKYLGVDASLKISYKIKDSQIYFYSKLVLTKSRELVSFPVLTSSLNDIGSMLKKEVKSIFGKFGKSSLQSFPNLSSFVNNQEFWNAIPTPNFESFKSYSKGLFIGDGKVPRAKNILKEARRKDRSFYLPLYKRYSLTYLYKSKRNLIIKKLDKYQKLNTGLKQRKLYWAMLWHRLAKIALQDKDYKSTDKCLYRELKILKELKFLNSVYYIDHLLLKSYRYYKGGLLELALSHSKTAEDLAKLISYSKGSYAMNIHILTGNIYMARGQYDMALWNYNQDSLLLQHYDIQNSLLKALLNYNIATLYSKLSSYKIALPVFQNAKTSLSSKGYNNSHLYLSLLLNLAYTQKQLGHINLAIKYYKQIELSIKMLGPELRIIYAASLYNRAKIFSNKKMYAKAKSLYYRAARIYRTLGLNKLAKIAVLGKLPEQTAGIHSVYTLPEVHAAGLTMAEARQIKSYTGAFNLERHSPGVRARTYVGRQDDTRVFIGDLINPKNDEDAALTKLRKTFLNNSVSTQGEGLLFIDIGPAIANINNPAITAMTIAKSFNKLKVVGLDLPREVKRFLKYVRVKKRKELLNKSNFYILSGDGLASLKKQLNNPASWVPASKPLPTIKQGDPIIIRAANSIDIYFPWNYIQNTLKNMAKDFIANPLLLFFNRSILYKPQGSDKFKLVGYVSIRGFHHNRLSYDRGGEKPYTFIKALLQ